MASRFAWRPGPTISPAFSEELNLARCGYCLTDFIWVLPHYCEPVADDLAPVLAYDPDDYDYLIPEYMDDRGAPVP